MIETISFEGNNYPKFQSEGNAAKFCIPFAKEVCLGLGYDIGGNNPEWALPHAAIIDPAHDPTYDAYNLPHSKVNYIFSSHCLEHLPDWVAALDYWAEHIIEGGVLFLYLPHFDQAYWRPWNNRKHVHSFTPEIIVAYLNSRGCWKNIFASQRDLNHSFIVMAEKV